MTIPPPPSAAHTTLLSMPAHTAALRHPWPRLAGTIPSLSIEWEDEFRFGHSVVKVGDAYRMGGSIKGGSSSIWVSVEKAALDAYTAWHEREGLARLEDAAAFTDLKRILADANITLVSDVGEYEPAYGGAYRIMRDIAAALPRDHLVDLAVDCLHVGGWGPDAAKASAYNNGTVHIYDFAVYGAARTLAGLFLHEFGHAFYASLKPEEVNVLAECHDVISRHRGFMGVEYLLDAQSRVVYQEFIPEEFVAETYLLYTACGGALREFIGRQEDEAAEAWWRAYSVFVCGFHGIGYL